MAQFYARCATNCLLCVKQFSPCLLLLEWHNFMIAVLQIVRYVWNNFRPVCGWLSGTILRSLRYKLSAMCGTIFTLFGVAWVAQFYARCTTNCLPCVEQFTLCLGLLEWHNFTLAAVQIVHHVWNNLRSVWGCLSSTILRLLRHKLSAMHNTIKK